MTRWLIQRAEVWRSGMADVRISDGIITAIGQLSPEPGERLIDAAGGALLPGLHDHHIHLAAEAVARQSVPCGPPDVLNEAALADALREAAARAGDGWLRGIGYHESVAGMLSATQIDAMVAHRPVRIQHRSGRMWFFNSLALEMMLANSAPSLGLERIDGRWTGRLFDDDDWTRRAIGGAPPCFAAVSRDLARCGVTGLSDMSARNGPETVTHFAAQQNGGQLQQMVMLAGRIDLIDAAFSPMLAIGPAKLHLHEWQLPDIDATDAFIRAAHAQGRVVATHCTSEVELVFALAALQTAGVMPGDRIEHAGIASDALVAMVADMGLAVVSQPHFIAERGDSYLRDVAADEHAHLYRLAAFARAGVTIAGGSDAPYGSIDPWAAMRAAVSRRTHGGVVVGVDEELTPEAALALYLGDPAALNVERRVEAGAVADLCLLDRPWVAARTRLLAENVRCAMVGGSIIHDGVNQSAV